MPNKLLYALALLFYLSLQPAQAQQVYDFQRETVEVSNLGISLTNVGIIGSPQVINQPTGAPSMQYPAGSGTEHLFEAGLWIGAQYDGSTRVSTAAVTDASGYSSGKSGFEFTADGAFSQRSTLPSSNYFTPQAISHQDLIANFTDRRTTSGNTPISNHNNPLYADVQMESYNWNFGFTEPLTILKYAITNNSHLHAGDGSVESGVTWDSVYVGMYSDMVVRNINTTIETGSNYFNKGGMGYIDSLNTLYAFDAGSGDSPRTNTYGANVILGSEYRGVEFHPRYADQVEAAGMRVPMVHPQFWKFGGGPGVDERPNTDELKYNRMSTPYPMESRREALRNDGKEADGNYIQLHTIGPFQEIEPGETVVVYMAFVAALFPQESRSVIPSSLGPNETPDTDANRQPLADNVDWAYRIFEGQVDAATGERERFLVPEPPSVPNLRVELDAGKAILYWDREAEFSIDPISNEQDFEGYRVFRSRLGADIQGGISASTPVMLREWDIPDNEFGFNTGFDEIALNEPATFADDDTEYWYRFEVDGMLSGWQYEFAVTAFDRGDGGVESMESSRNANAIRVFPGTPANDDFEYGYAEVGVYPIPYRVNAAWDGGTPFTRKLNFYNLPARAEIRVYTLTGERVAELEHNSSTTTGDTRWYNDFSSENRVTSGGELSWDLLSAANQNLATGLYLFSVKDLDSGAVQTGKFAVIK